jgi:hypothetical protein
VALVWVVAALSPGTSHPADSPNVLNPAITIAFQLPAEAPVDVVGVPAVLAALVGCLFTSGDKWMTIDLSSV